MDEQLVKEVSHTWEDRPTDDLLNIWVAHDQDEWSPESFEAIRRILADRGVSAPPQAAQQNEDGAGDDARPPTSALRTLPPRCGYFCMVCGSSERGLRFRELKVAIGYLFYRRTRVRHGYICWPCAIVATLGSLVYGAISCVLLQPQAFFWTPKLVLVNLYNTLFGKKPDVSWSVSPTELSDGVVTAAHAGRLRAAAMALMQDESESGYEYESGLFLATLAVLNGAGNAAYVAELRNSLQAVCERGPVKARRARMLLRMLDEQHGADGD